MSHVYCDHHYPTCESCVLWHITITVIMLTTVVDLAALCQDDVHTAMDLATWRGSSTTDRS